MSRAPTIGSRSFRLPIASALALTASLILWPACSSPSAPSSPLAAGGQASGPGLGQAATGGSACAVPASCDVSDQGPSLLLTGGSRSSGGAGGADGSNGLCQPPALKASGCVPALADGSEAQCNGLDDDRDGVSMKAYSAALDQCCWANCEASLQGDVMVPPQVVNRANWGYANSALGLCPNTLQGGAWQSLGYCSSPRLDIDNNLVDATGVPVDAPKDDQTFAS